MSDLGHKSAPSPSPLVLYTAIAVLALPNFTVWTGVVWLYWLDFIGMPVRVQWGYGCTVIVLLYCNGMVLL